MQILFNSLIKNPPPKIICIGKNYIKHIKEMGGKNPPKDPIFFFKPHTSLTHSKTIKIDLTNEIHHEIELGLIIKKSGKNISRKKWKDYIGGYFLALDLTDRNLQKLAKHNSQPWSLSKGKDNFLPLGNFIDAERILNPHDLKLILSKNGKVVQKGWTGDMYFKIDEVLEYVSQEISLTKGDIFLLGTLKELGGLNKGIV